MLGLRGAKTLDGQDTSTLSVDEQTDRPRMVAILALLYYIADCTCNLRNAHMMRDGISACSWEISVLQ